MKKLDLDKQKSSPRTYIPIPKQSQEKQKHSQMKTHQVNVPSQTIPSTQLLSSNKEKEKDSNELSSTYRHRLLKQNPKLRNSISSKEDFRAKNQAGPPMQIDLPKRRLSKKNQININPNVINTNTNANSNINLQCTPQMTGNSNCILTTNYSDKEDDKKTTVVTAAVPITKTVKPEITLNSLKHLGNLFRSSNFKQTIIIDDEGNNNLNLDLKHMTNRKTFIKNNVDRNPLKIGHQTPKGGGGNGDMPIKVSSKNTTNTKANTNNTNSNHVNSNNNNEQADNNRLNEYKMIFNLLNSNIDQMKNIIEKNTITNTNKHSEPQEIANRIISQKDIEEINKITHIELPTDITNNTIVATDNNNNNNNYNVKSNNNNSFLDSCIDEDFYQSFAKHKMFKTTTYQGGINSNNNNIEHKLNLSFEYSTILPKGEENAININTNRDKDKDIPPIVNVNVNVNDVTECENYEDEGKDNKKVNIINAISPHFLLQKAKTFSHHKSTKHKSREPSCNDNDDVNVNEEKNKCLIY